MRKRGESPGSKSVQFISKNLDLFSLLFSDVKQLSLMSHFLDSLVRVAFVVRLGVRLQVHNLVSLVHIVLQLSGLCLELFRLLTLLLDLTLQFGLGLIDGLDTLGSVFLKLFDLVVKAFLVLFNLLRVLALDDLLSLFSHSVKLHVLGSLFKIFDFKVKSLLLITNLLQIHFECRDFVHKFDFLLSLTHDFFIFKIDQVLLNENGVLVISSNRKLGNFYLTLFKVHNHFEIKLDLFDSLEGFSLGN